MVYIMQHFEFNGVKTALYLLNVQWNCSPLAYGLIMCNNVVIIVYLKKKIFILGVLKTSIRYGKMKCVGITFITFYLLLSKCI